MKILKVNKVNKTLKYLSKSRSFVLECEFCLNRITENIAGDSNYIRKYYVTNLKCGICNYSSVSKNGIRPTLLVDNQFKRCKKTQ